ncbi:MAG: hypothetical protein GQ565_05895 [Candidatus Aegiribacteria sp.]|nr:hypothetical protein [Candidatus Aegiribacteria sp.]
MTLDHSILRNQFLLTKDPDRSPSGWMIRSIEDWLLSTHPSLPVINILDSRTDEIIGWLLGHPINLSGPSLLTSSNVRCDTPDSWSSMEKWLFKHAGRYIAVLFMDGATRVYLDPTGSLAALFSIEEETVCSTCSVISKGPSDNDYRSDLIDRYPNWYPFGFTPHRTLSRLLPNHYLDCGTWKAERHWPSDGEFVCTQDPESTLRLISSTVTSIIRAVNTYGCYIGLTAGADTRIVLACAAHDLQQSVFFTGAKELDLHTAKILAKRFGIRHITLELHPASLAEQKERLFVTGYCSDTGGHGYRSVYTSAFDDGALVLMGLAGEVGRTRYWEDGDSEEMELTPEDLLRRLKIPALPESLAGAVEWLSFFHGWPLFHILDLLFLEQQMGCWGGPNRYFYDFLGFPEIYAFGHRDIYRSMMCIPFDYRTDNGLLKGICKLNWPELLDLPINKYTGLKLLGKKIKKVVSLLKSC